MADWSLRVDSNFHFTLGDHECPTCWQRGYTNWGNDHRYGNTSDSHPLGSCCCNNRYAPLWHEPKRWEDYTGLVGRNYVGVHGTNHSCLWTYYGRLLEHVATQQVENRKWPEKSNRSGQTILCQSSLFVTPRIVPNHNASDRTQWYCHRLSRSLQSTRQW